MRSSPNETGPAGRAVGCGRGWLLVLLITLAVWTPELRNDFVNWDDLNMIVHNPLFNPPNWSGVGWYWIHPAWNLYQPMTTTLWSFLAWAGWVDAPDQFGGHMNPAIFHLASILLHAFTAVFLFQILRLVIKNDVAATIGAMLFALHPMQVESVAFAGAMNVPLSGCLSLLAIWRYLVLADPAKTESILSRTRGWTIASVALLLALFAKPTAVVCAPIAFVFDLVIHRRSLRRMILTNVLWEAMTIVCVIWTCAIQHGSDAARSPIWFRPIVASDAIAFYLAKILFPLRLSMEYDRTPQAIHAMRDCWLTLLAPIALIAPAFFLRARRPLFAAAIAIFLTALLPNSGLMPFDSQSLSTVSDRYVYLSMVGVAVFLAAVIQIWPLLKYPAIVVLIALTIQTEYQLTTWRNGVTLYRKALSDNPNAWYAAGNLAVVIGDQSPDEAISLCRRSINLRSDRADVWNTLGSLLMDKGNRTEALSAFEIAQKLSPADPTFSANLARAKKELSASTSNPAAPLRLP
jgi:hypothetical protein